MDSGIYKRKRVFSVGEKSRVLSTFATKLENDGFSVKWSAKSADVNAVVQNFHGNHFDVVLFGRSVKPENKKLIMQRFRSQNEQLLFIDVLAPVSDLMADQVKLAFLAGAGSMPCVVKTGDNNILSIEILQDCLLQVKSYIPKWLSRCEENLLLNARLQGGVFSLPLKATPGKQFIVVSVDEVIVYIHELA